MKFNLEDKNFQIVLGLIAIVIASIAFCQPALKGEFIIASDNYMNMGAQKEALDFQKETGEYVPWTNGMFSGMPASGVYKGVRNYFDVLIYWGKYVLGGHSFDVFMWLMIGLFILLLSLKINIPIAVLISIAFGITTYNTTSIEHGHFMKILSIAFVAPSIAGVLLIAQKQYVKGFIILSIFLNMIVRNNHVQITYYLAMMIAIICLVIGIRQLINKDYQHVFKSGAILFFVAAITFMSNYSILNTLKYGGESTRGGKSELNEENKALDIDYATEWSYGIKESMTFLVPNFMGGSGSLIQNHKGKLIEDSKTYRAIQQHRNDPQINQLAQKAGAYWGEQRFVGGSIYFGVVIIFLALLGIINTKKQHLAWILPCMFLMLFLSWGRNFSVFTEIFYYNFPMYNKFRVPSMCLSVFQVFLFALAGFGLNSMLINKIERKDKLKSLYIALGIVGGLIAMFIIIPSLAGFMSTTKGEDSLPNWLLQAMIEDRKALFMNDAIRSLIFLVIAFVPLWLIVNEKIKQITLVVLAVGLIAIVDLWGVSRRYVNADDFKSQRDVKKFFKMSAVDRQIKQDKDPHYRVFNLTINPFNENITSYHHKSIGGYHGAKLRRYQELIENHISKNNRKVWNMLNTKYIISGRRGAEQLVPNPAALGNAWFIDSLVVVNDGKEEIEFLGTDTFEPNRNAVIQSSYLGDNPKIYNSKDGSIKLTKYLPHRMTYESNSNSQQFAVFSEIFFSQTDGDGWRAYVDDKEVDIKKVNYALRGLLLDAGKHTIKFEFDVSSSVKRIKIGFYFFLLVVGLVLAAIFYLFSNKNEKVAT